MFWGLILKSNKKYTQTLEKSFHLSQASLDHSSSDNDPVQVMYTHDDNSYLLCTLQKGKVYQCRLDLNFQEGDKLCFSTKGSGIVHLTGFLIQDDFDDFDENMMDEEEDESMDEEAVEDLRKKLEAGKKKQKPIKEPVQAAKKQQKQQQVEEDDSEDEDDSNEEESDDSDDEQINQPAGDDSADEDDSEEEDDDSDDEPAPPAKQPKLDAQAQQNGKKQKQKNGLENGDNKKPQQQQQKDAPIKKLQGGLQIQDLKTGSGAEAKPGKKIQVYYEGRLKSNNKVFDSTKSGAGFKLTLGKGEVIKGWDLGLSGMKVGGKRRIVCPPQLAYGSKGNPPVIPQNATLVFDVELKNVL